MSSFATMIEDTLSEASSYIRNQESITVLTQAADADDVELVVDDATQISKGLVEVGDELVYIKSVNKNAGTATVLPGGRGWKGSTAASHAVNTIIRNNPTFPRSQIKRAINDTINAVDLRAIKSTEFEFDGTRYAYVLPTDFDNVTGVSWNAPDTTEVWPIIRRYRIDRNWREESAPTVERSAIVLNEYPQPGRTVRVQYTGFANSLATGDDFSDTGLPASCEDVIRLGAIWRLLSTVDSGKVVANTPSADLVDAPIKPGDSTTVARYVYQLFTVRLAEEKAKQADNFFSVINYQR
jgi:hypothetical protein